jgi:hypothetical protein
MALAPAPGWAEARGDGTKTFVARPKIGNAELNLPSTVGWMSVANPNGTYRVSVTAAVDAQAVLNDIKTLTAKALDRDIPCGDVVKVRTAAAKLTGPRSLKYDLRFHYVKRICAGSYPVELPADVTCSARIGVSAQRAIVAVDVQGATNPPCRIEGLYQSVSDAIYALVGIDVFKRHAIDLTSLLPSEFKGVTINVRSIALDQPPARAVARITGEGTMSRAQFDTFIANLEATAPRTN